MHVDGASAMLDARHSFRTPMRRPARVSTRILAGLVILGVLAMVALMLSWRASLARLDGDLPLPGLSAPATIERDALGIATIDAADEADMARALGFVHAQERFF